MTHVEVLGDSTNGSEPMLVAIGSAGNVALVKSMPLRAAVPGGITIDDFTIDEDTPTATCLAGRTRPITSRGNVTFGTICRGCPLAARCTTSTRGRKLILTVHDRLLREHRARAGIPQFQQPCRQHGPALAWHRRALLRKLVAARS